MLHNGFVVEARTTRRFLFKLVKSYCNLKTNPLLSSVDFDSPRCKHGFHFSYIGPLPFVHPKRCASSCIGCRVCSPGTQARPTFRLTVLYGSVLDTKTLSPDSCHLGLLSLFGVRKLDSVVALSVAASFNVFMDVDGYRLHLYGPNRRRMRLR